ncbi:MAG: hypothetical protein Ct9H300mP8_04730 [Gammaproteobacteria bacterium]|nr:MAG: hypothetical protein Ct9H300mP8_04730 [Gammaproteobacteria bacterium]
MEFFRNEGNALESLGIILFAVISRGCWRGVGRFLASKADGPTGPIPARDYFQGLNHLLNERPDLAVETFIKALPVDDETIDTHLAWVPWYVGVARSTRPYVFTRMC